MKKPDIYISTDIETDGFVPGLNSMLSLGSAAFLEDKTLLSTFSVNFELLEEAVANPITTKWWESQPAAWQACRENQINPLIAMQMYHDWLLQLPGRIIFVGYPLVYDIRFIDYYFQRFIGENPFKFNAIDIRSYAMGMLNLSYQNAGKDHLPERWLDNLPHTHIALDDALEQGALFCNMLLEQKKLNKKME